MKTAALLDLPLVLNRHCASVHQALYQALRDAILEGRLAPGARLPATRALSRQLRVARGTVVVAFEQLLAEGYTEAKVGSGTLVKKTLPETWLSPAKLPATGRAVKPVTPTLSRWAQTLGPSPFPLGVSRPPRAFQPHRPDVGAFPHEAWGRLLARRARKGESSLLSEADAGGYLPLRRTLSAHLAAARGVKCAPERLVITPSLQQSLYLVARLVLDPGDQVWLEEPGYTGARAAFAAAGAKLTPVPVDAHGIDVEHGIRHAPNARLAYLTPAHQAPLGVMLSMERRLKLLAWAQKQRAWLFEDDYDSEYRYEGRPLPALQGLDHAGVVIHAGSFSKTLYPALRLSYVALPDALYDRFLAAKSITDRYTPVLQQAGLADFLDSGLFVRHLRRMRELYAVRHQALISALACELPEWRLAGAAAGLDLSVWLPPRLDDRIAAQRLGEAGIDVQPLSDYMLQRKTQGGLLLGFAAFSPRRLRQAVALMGAEVRGLAPSSKKPKTEEIARR